MSRPTLLLQTVYLHENDARAARRLGRALYGRLTRPPGDPVAYGAGIPVLCGVAADRVDPTAADRVVQLALGRQLETAVTEARRVLIGNQMPDWANYVLYGNADLRLQER